MKKSVVKFVSLFCVLCIVLCMSGCAPTVNFFIFPDSDDNYDGSCYNQLNDFQKKLYRALLEPISNAEEKIQLNNININDFDEYYYATTIAITYDHPEYFWYRGSFSSISRQWTYYELGTIVVRPRYYAYVTSFFDVESKQNALNSAVENVAELARNYSDNDHERIMFVHDYLIKNARYDHDGLEEYYKTNHNPSCEYIYSAYGCLVEGDTVCSGYAKAFQLILTKLGYDCTYVVSDTHAWNCVYLDGEGYFVDVTWDDYDREKEVPFYNYALITSDEISKTHTVDMEYFENPVCYGTKYNYFRYNGYYDEEYDFETTKKIIEKQKDKEVIHIRYSSLEELTNAKNDLMKNDKHTLISVIATFDVYYTDDEFYVLSIVK